MLNYNTDGGILFAGDNYKYVDHDPAHLEFDFLYLTGKILCWTLIHGGAWPTWLHPYHINFFLGLEINFIEIFQEIQPNLYKIANQIKTDNSVYNQIKDWWSNYRNIGVSIINNCIYLYKNIY